MSDLTLTFYGEIGLSWWGDGVTARDVADTLAENPTASAIDVRINSPGGNVFDAAAILAQLQQHPARIVIHVDGVAASAASVIAMAGDEIRISEGGFIMIHEASGGVWGRASDHRRVADMLASVNRSMADVYTRRCHLAKADVLAAMAAETWYSAHDAVAAGLADTVVPGDEITACVGQARFKHTPPAVETTATSRPRPPRWRLSEQVQKSLANLSNTEIHMELSVLISALGLEAGADETTVLQTITKLRSASIELSANGEKLSADLASALDQVTALSDKLAGLESDKAVAELDAKLAALKADARITDGQADVIRGLFEDGHTESAMKLASSFEQSPQIAPTGPRQSLKSDDAGANRKPSPGTVSGDLDWYALASEIPEHIRTLSRQMLSADPRGFFEANKCTPWVKALGIDWANVAPRKA